MNKIKRKASEAVPFNPNIFINASIEHRATKQEHQQLIRHTNTEDTINRDRELNELIGSNPTQVFRRIKSLKNARSSKVNKMIVGERTYFGDSVPDGLFHSIETLKTSFSNPPTSYPDYREVYRHIIDICKEGKKIPPITRDKSQKILLSIRKNVNVNDFYSITAQHYVNAGVAGEEHFFFLLNAVITEINLASLQELNNTYACILYKGHSKDKTSERSYRTIFTCPLHSKALDIYVRELSIDAWNLHQAETQFQRRLLA